ncbi:MAG TPA: phosphodiester glycosidase family protein [Clostridia bacterium]|nr:phosphodiester glycosidase family protein [Clostridia bacterium]
MYVKTTGNNKFKSYISAAILIVMSLILIYVGHFLFGVKNSSKGEIAADESSIAGTVAETPGTAPTGSAANAVRYVHKSETLNGLKQEVNILEIDPGAGGIKILPVLSYDLIYGFEKLSAMAERKAAYAAVNGGFFREFGLPSGMVVINGELISASTGKYPVFVIEDGKASLKEINGKLSIEYSRSTGASAGGAGAVGSSGSIGSRGGSADSGKSDSSGSNGKTADGPAASPESLPVDNLNALPKDKQIVVYTPAYGKSNRARKRNITATIVDGIVTRISDYSGEAEIPENGMLISFFDTLRYTGIELPIKEGDSAKLAYSPAIGADMQAYECGSWLVRNGAPVVGEKDAWVGVMTNRDPRTAVGIKADGTVILLTVDGRQPGFSAGFTGQELAEYLIGCGARDAAMLDGGASTEMLLKGKLVNRPSYRGQERELAGGILVLTDN